MTKQLADYSDPVSKIKTKTLRQLVENDPRVIGFTIEDDGVFIYTDSDQWCDDAGAGTFRGDSETAAVRDFRERVQRAEPATTTTTTTGNTAMKLILSNAKGEQVAEYRGYTERGFGEMLLQACESASQLAERQRAADPDHDAFSHRAMLSRESGCIDGRYFDGAHVVYEANPGKYRAFPDSDFAGALEYLMGC